MTGDASSAYEAVTEVPRSEIRDAFAAVLQARLPWPQAAALASDLIGYLHRQGLVVFREYHPHEVTDEAMAALRYIASPTMGRPSDCRPADHVGHMDDREIRRTLRTVIERAQAALASAEVDAHG